MLVPGYVFADGDPQALGIVDTFREDDFTGAPEVSCYEILAVGRNSRIESLVPFLLKHSEMSMAFCRRGCVALE